MASTGLPWCTASTLILAVTGASVVFRIQKRQAYGIVSDIETQGELMATRRPRPGVAVRGSTTGRPLMAALDLLGRRWALRILWELRAEPLGARELRSRCDQMSSSVLYERLSELNDAGLVARDESGAYQLTGLGDELRSALRPLDSWARRWSDAQQEPEGQAASADHGT
jgi:DNA-binding HxlR family transcriptional regulator